MPNPDLLRERKSLLRAGCDMPLPPAELAQRCRFQACLTTDRAVAKVLRAMAEYFDDEANAAKSFFIAASWAWPQVVRRR